MRSPARACLSVADLERSMGFRAVGFGMSRRSPKPRESDHHQALMNLPDSRGWVMLMQSPVLELERLQLELPMPRSRDALRPAFDHVGTHAVAVDEVAPATERLRSAGAACRFAPARPAQINGATL